MSITVFSSSKFGHNVGRRLVTVELMDRSELLVDKGYIYAPVLRASPGGICS